MAIDTPALYVSCISIGSDEGYIFALDPGDLSVKDQVTLPPYATRLAMRPDGYRLWVSHPGTNQITILNSNTFEIMHTIDFGDVDHRPYQMTIRTPGSMMFPQLILACQFVNKIHVYNMYTYYRQYEFDVETVRTDPACPAYVKLTPNERFLYVYAQQDPANKDHIAVFDLGTTYNLREVTQNDEFCIEDDCSLPPEPSAVRLQESVFNPEGSRLYIANMRTNRIEVVDTTANVYLEPIIVEGFTSPRSLALSPTGTYLYIGYTTHASEDGGFVPGYIVMFNLEDETVVHFVEIPENPRTMILNPSGDRLFVAEHGTHEVYAYDINVGSESPLSLAATVNLDLLVNTGSAAPVEILYLERRPLLPVSPYVVVALEGIFKLFQRLWYGFFKPIFGFFSQIVSSIFSGMKKP